MSRTKVIEEALRAYDPSPAAPRLDDEPPPGLVRKVWAWVMPAPEGARLITNEETNAIIDDIREERGS